MYEAWAPYNSRALGLQLGAQLRRPVSERTPARIEASISYAAYRCSVDLFPALRTPVFDPFMQRLGYNIADVSSDLATPQGLGNVAAAAVLQSRRDDSSNQTGQLTPSGVPYADYTGYAPVNPPSTVPVNPALVVDVNDGSPCSTSMPPARWSRSGIWHDFGAG